MEIVRYLTLAGLLFSIGVYGALTRRSFAGALLSLSISAAAIAVAFVTFNRLIQPSETDGYFFALTILMLSVVYGAFVAQFVRRAEPSKSSSRPEQTSAAESAGGCSVISAGAPLVSEAPARISTPAAQVRFSRRSGEGFVGLISFAESFAFQVSVMMIFVVGFLLMRLSAPAALAFVGGVAVLTHMLHRRRQAEQLKKKPASGIRPVVQTRTNKP